MDGQCKCDLIVEDINKKFPNCDWNCDLACQEWDKRQHELKDNNIVFEAWSDESLACTCPECGKWICGWCV